MGTFSFIFTFSNFSVKGTFRRGDLERLTFRGVSQKFQLPLIESPNRKRSRLTSLISQFTAKIQKITLDIKLESYKDFQKHFEFFPHNYSFLSSKIQSCNLQVAIESIFIRVYKIKNLVLNVRSLLKREKILNILENQ